MLYLKGVKRKCNVKIRLCLTFSHLIDTGKIYVGNIHCEFP